MDANVISALIVAGFALVGSVVSSKYVSNVRVVKLEMKMQELEKKVDKHNHLVERTYALEREVALLKNDDGHIFSLIKD